MSVFLIPEVNHRWFLNNGQPNAGGQLFFYAAGTTTPVNTYTDATGLTPNPNPIILDSGGNPPNMIWGTAGQRYKVVPEDSLGNPAGLPLDNLQNIDDTVSATFSEWLSGPTPTYISTTSFSVAGNQTASFSVGRRIQAAVSAGTVYGTIITSTFGSGITTVTLVMDPSQALDSGLTAVSYGILQYINQSMPEPNPSGGTVASAATLNLETNYGDVITGTTAITSVVLGQGKERTLVAQTVGLTVQNSGSLITQTGRTITCAAGDRLTFKALNGNVYVTIKRSLYPAFIAQYTSPANITSNTAAVYPAQTTIVNDGTCYNTGTFVFTPTVPGRYQVSVSILFSYSSGAGSFTNAYAQLYLNGSPYDGGAFSGANGPSGAFSSAQPSIGANITALIDMNGTTDNLKVFYTVSGISGTITATAPGVWSAVKVDP